MTRDPTAAALPDLIEHLLGLPTESPALQLRRERDAVRTHAEAAYRAVLLPTEPGGITRPERAAMAVRVARQDGCRALATHYEAMLSQSGTAAEIAAAGAPVAEGPGRLALLMRWADLVGQHPGRIVQASIDALTAAGLSAQDIVAATQLVAFVPFQVRLLAGLRAMAGSPAVAIPPVRAADAGFTLAEVRWLPRVEPIDAAHATEAQRAALDACPPAVRRSTDALTLAHDPASFAERGALFDHIMDAPHGLPRADRELATAVVSMVNGCVYCTSVHARLLAQLSSDAAMVEALLQEGLDAPLPPRPRAIAAFAAKLTAAPQVVGAADLVALQSAGLVPLEQLDLIHAVAMFANTNRLMQALGNAEPPETR